MRDEASRSVDGPRAMRRRSLTRQVWCDAELPAELVETLCAGDVDSVLFSSIPLQVKDRCVVGRYESKSASLLVKRHVWGELSRTLRMMFREPAALRCARLGTYLHSHGVPTPRPRATVNYRIGPWTYRSYLISDYVEGTSLYRYIRFGSQTAVELRHVAGQVAQIWQQLVELGVSHNDLKPENFIVDEKSNVWLIDLEKVRVGGKAKRQRQRQAYDVKNFLHVRGWHHRADARAIFAEAFLQTSCRDWLQQAAVDDLTKLVGPSDAESDADLSVVILCAGGIKMPLALQAIDSVADIADEIVLAEPIRSDRLDVLKRIEICPPLNMPISIAMKPAADSPGPHIFRGPWVLVLEQHECVTPFLAKELQQRIADAKANAAFRIPLDAQYFGRTLARPAGEQPIRLFRLPECSYSAASGNVSVSADADQVGQLAGSIQACKCATISEFIERLNEQSTSAAIHRLQAGQRSRLVWGAWRAARQFFDACLPRGGIRSGWVGLEIAALESVFTWIEEAKLHQLAGEFHHAISDEEPSAERSAELGEEHGSSAPPWAKAA